MTGKSKCGPRQDLYSYWIVVQRAFVVLGRRLDGLGTACGLLHGIEGSEKEARAGAIPEAVIARPSIRSKQQAQFDRVVP